MSSTAAKGDRIERGNYTQNVPGSTTFIGLRALDPFIQWSILANSHFGIARTMIESLGGELLAQGPSSNTGVKFIDALGLSPYRLVLLSMATAASAKHMLWKAFVGEEHMTVSTAGMVAVFNTFFNSANSILFITKLTSVADGRGEGPNWPGWPGARLSVGAACFTVGIVLEMAAELQRKSFKKRNPGLPCTTGLFGVARNINYTAYTLWRFGYAVAAGGWIWGALQAGLFAWDFGTRAVPMLNEYCELKYADAWHDYCKKTPYTLFPGIY